MPHPDWISRNCPICDSTSKPRLVASSKKPAEDLSFKDVCDLFVGLRQDQVFFSYYRCVNCGLLYCPYYFSTEQLEKLYADMPDNLMGEDKGTASRTQGGYVGWMAKKVDRIESFLEIGPDVGLVSSEIVSRFHPTKASLVEPNSSIHRQLQESVSHVSEIELVKELRELSAGSHDLIVGVHVLDHLLDPRGDLALLTSLSNSQSKLVFVVHNEKSALRHLMKSKWPPFCLQHPQLFNPDSISRLLQSAGWSLDTYARSTNWWHLRNLVGTGLRIFGLPAKFARLLPNVEVPTKLGNFIGLASRN